VIYRVDPDTNQSIEVYHHQFYVRDLAFDPAGRLYFSEAWGAGGDGMILRVTVEPHVVVEPFYAVRLAQVHNYWAGDFTFDRSGTLYLSSGNHIGAHVYRVNDPGAGSPPIAVHSEPGSSICGIALDRDNRLHYSSWSTGLGTIYRLDLATHERVAVHSFPDRSIWDVSFR
jgi:hypothetical protein